jgi:hypothetical protein
MEPLPDIPPGSFLPDPLLPYEVWACSKTRLVRQQSSRYPKLPEKRRNSPFSTKFKAAVPKTEVLERLRLRKYMPGIMLAVMTLYGRNVFFRAEIAVSGVFLVLAAILALEALPACPGAMEDAVNRAPGIFQGLVARFLRPSPLVPVVSLFAAALLSLAALVLIYFFFEKTQAPEILFVMLFVFSLSFEIMRIMTPLQKIRSIPSVYLLWTSRTLLFGRFFGIFSLFAASIYAAGLEVQRQANIILVAVFVSLVVSMGIPIDVLTWDSSFSMINSHLSLFRMVEAVMLLTTMVSFFISAWSRGTPEYLFTGLGSFLVFTGRNMLLTGDTWLSPLPGLLLTSAGIWLICTKLHKVYLWL